MRAEEEYIRAITRLLNGRNEAPPEVFPLLDEALREHPASSELWCLRGDVIYFSHDDHFHPEDMLASYERAAELHPSCAEAYESIGRYHDVFSEDLPKAEEAFRKALTLGAGWVSVYGLARVLAQLDRREEALSLLGEPIPGEEADIADLRQEILSGLWNPVLEPA
jgi:tetratricopeptide (TPR) repeat protein